MRRLSLIIGTIVLLTSMKLIISSPHGKDFNLNCDDCHSTSGWKVNTDSINFSHDSTAMPLVGRHVETNCRDCHESLIFKDAEPYCNACHTDMHENTVGQECNRCHTPSSWIVTNIIDIHRHSRFPLLGAHSMADCQECHSNASLLKFEPLGIECFDCHQADYMSTSSPDHSSAGYSTNCTECHFMNAFTWQGAGINHDFFPLKEGHDIADCMQCHTDGNFSSIPNTCISCHEQDYNAAVNPNHSNSGFPTTCNECHTLAPGWAPAEFTQHDGLYFPIYSGQHEGEWENCGDCHKNSSNYGIFTCTDCHEHNEGDMNNEHDDVGGYTYNSLACFGCHPTGSAEGGFNHSTTSFPLTGAHTGATCLDCHSAGYAGTSTFCYDCHETEFNQSANPGHVTIGIPNTCADCHTTQPGWAPATFPIHNQYYTLNGAHAAIANECSTCHNGNYTNTPNTCKDCHLTDYNQTTNPPHASVQFGLECAGCHTETAWQPATFNHDVQYFPIYSGQHNGTWTLCSDCHTNSSSYAQFSCIDCHEHNQADMNDEHTGIQGYEYNSSSCLACHPDGSANGAFNHGNTAFPLTGAHTGALCSDCHTSGYTGTTTICGDCHEPDFNQAANPNHVALNIPGTCADCHSTQPGWAPAAFPIHNQYYALNGAHQVIASECATCHNGNYISTPNTCAGCHLPDYNQTTNPPHASSQFPLECTVCHTETAWQPSIFDHGNTSFPLTGAHTGALCSDCHTSGYTGTTTICGDCHEPDYNQAVNPNHVSLNIPSSCADCHSTQPGWTPASFPIHNQYYTLNGAHSVIANECATCHNGNYVSTPNTCSGCHLPDYNQTTNPSHVTLQLPLECLECHQETTWSPATFSIHNQYYVLNGAHALIADECASCHNGNYTTTPNTCEGCHIDDYNQTINPPHASAQFPTDCLLCHTESAWIPSTFDHDNQYFPIYSGQHQGEWTLCSDCHPNPSNYTQFTCIDCHEHNQTDMDQEHQGVSGYVYSSPSCLACHPDGNSKHLIRSNRFKSN